MHAQNLSQEALADRLGITRQALSPYLTGKKAFDLDRLDEIARILRCSTFSLTGADSLVDAETRPTAKFPGVEHSYLEAALWGLYQARRTILETPLRGSGASTVGHSKTTLIDGYAEAALAKALHAFNPEAALVSEDQPDKLEMLTGGNRTAYVVDPLDRTSALNAYLAEFLEQEAPPATVQEAFERSLPGRRLEGFLAPCGTVTLVRNGRIVFNVILNYRDNTYYLAWLGPRASEVRALRWPSDHLRPPSPAELLADGEEVEFVAREGRCLACFAGDRWPEPQENNEYHRNLKVLGLTGENPAIKDGPFYIDSYGSRAELLGRPPGPPRVLYLTNQANNDRDLDCVGGIISNGEKMCEWLGWLAWVAASEGALEAYEVWADDSPMRAGVLMSPSEKYSIFRRREAHNGQPAGLTIDWEVVRDHDNPTLYRGAILVVPRSNRDFHGWLRTHVDKRKLELT